MFKKLAKTVAVVMMAATVATNLSSVMTVEASTEVQWLSSQEEIDNISAELSKEHPDLNEIERKLDTLKEKGVQFEESVKMRLQLAQKKKKAHEKD